MVLPITGNLKPFRPRCHSPETTTKIFVDTTKLFVVRSRPDKKSGGLMAMPKKGPPRPTDGELGILRVLWQRGPSTVREVQEALNEVRPTGYTTVLKTLQIMTEKGLV